MPEKLALSKLNCFSAHALAGCFTLPTPSAMEERSDSADRNVPEGLLWAGQIDMAALCEHGEPEVVGVVSSFPLFFLRWTEYKWSVISALLQGWFGKEFFTFAIVSLHSCVFGLHISAWTPGPFGKIPFGFCSGLKC